MEQVLRKVGVHRSATIFNKSVQLLAYADDINIIGRCKHAVTADFSTIQKESEKVDLMVNEGKTKYKISSSRGAQRNQCQREITTDGYIFEAVKEFTYYVPLAITA